MFDKLTPILKWFYLKIVEWEIDIFSCVPQQLYVRQKTQKLSLQHQCIS